MDCLSLFIPITKVDASRRLVYGVATAECEDRAGEICDYASTKPLYEKWSSDIQKATEGKSLGNLRAMHGKVAAGKITAISFNDDAKLIEICAKVVDDAEWQKVCEGVYTGFSQGGSYVKRWRDEEGLQRYTADPSEISLVDLPCLSRATFQMIKADGETLELRFKGEPASAEEWERVWKSKRDGATFKTKGKLRKYHERLDAAQKRGARNSAVDQTRIQDAHDALVDAGAQCGATSKAQGAHEPGASQATVTKIAAERDASEKGLAALKPLLDEILQRLSKIEGQPKPLPFAGQPRVVSKSEDVGAATATGSDDIAKFVEANRDVLVIEAIKLAQRQPHPIASRR